MATVTGVTAARAQEIQDESIVSASIVGNDLIFTKGDAAGTTVNAGRVIPPAVNSWPVGTIFMNTSATNPATLLGGGTWVRWGKGRVPVSLDEAQVEFDTSEETGGAKTHTLTTAQMPAHAHGGSTGLQSADHTHGGYTTYDGNHAHSTPNHTHPGLRVDGTSALLRWADNARASGGGAGIVPNSSGTADVEVANGGGSGTGTSGSHNHGIQTYGVSANHYHAITAEGGGAAHNILQPYITVYMWKRTA